MMKNIYFIAVHLFTVSPYTFIKLLTVCSESVNSNINFPNLLAQIGLDLFLEKPRISSFYSVSEFTKTFLKIKPLPKC